MSKQTVVCIGMGAVGCLYMSHLNPELCDVHAVARSDAREMAERGVCVLDPAGNERVWQPVRVYDAIEQVSVVPDYVVIATKALPGAVSFEALRFILSESTTLLLLQNGLHIERPYLEAFPNHVVMSGLAFVCASKTGPACVHHQDFGRLVVGVHLSGHDERANRFVSLFEGAPFHVQASDDIVLERYKKLLWNAPFNCLSVLEGGKNTQELLEDSERVERIMQIMKDVQLLAHAAGCDIPDSVLQRHIDDTRRMKPYKPSMCLDWEAGRPLEYDAILGNALTVAKKKGITVPSLEVLAAEMLG